MDCCQSNVRDAAHGAARWCVRSSSLPFFLSLRQQTMLLAVSCLLASCWSTDSLAAKQGRQSQMLASTSDAARREAVQAIPFKKIGTQYRHLVHKVITDSSLYRRMPTQIVDCDPQLFTFLIKNPEMLVEIWQQMGISRVMLERTGDNTFTLSDGAGTTGKLLIVEQQCDGRAQNRIVMYSEGAYEGKPFKRPVRAQCVLLLRSGSTKETNGRDYVACRLDSFVRIERTSIKLFAKAMHPWVGKTADANFADTISFISNLSKAAEKRPNTIERLVNSLPRVTEHRQQQLVRIAQHCSQKYTGKSARLVAQKAKSRSFPVKKIQ